MYPTIRNALSIFSIQTGLDESAARRALRDSLENPAWRSSLHVELEPLIADERQSRIELIANEVYEVDEADDEDEAWEIIVELLWPDVFPDRARPF